MDLKRSLIDTALVNGNVVTVNQFEDLEEAVGIKGNRIVFVGPTKDLLSLADHQTKVIDVGGRTITPGFIDSHYHPILNGFFGLTENATIIDTSYENCPSLEDILHLIRKAVHKRGPGQWISMMGYDQNSVREKRHITIEELDEAAPLNPVQCMRTCGHISIYNSRALQQIGINNVEDAKKYPDNEVVVEQGRLTGMVKDHTHFLLWSKVNYTEKQQVEAALKSNDLLLSQGITSVHDAGEFGASSYKIMQRLCKERTFKPRVYMMLHSVFGKPFSLEENQHFLSLGLETGLGDEYFRIGSSKFMIDGGSGGPSAATREPYSHDPKMPYILGWTREEVAEYIQLLNDSGCQATAHAVGDLAVEFMVEGYEKAFERTPKPHLRHRIEHTAIVDEMLVERMARLEICPTCNPGFISWNGRNYEKYYGERMKYFMALRTMLDHGVKVALASDAPSGPAGSMEILDACVNRIDRVTNQPVDSTQCISMEEALRAYTIHGAWASFEDSIKGSIEVGKLADMAVLSLPILQQPKEKILEVKVDMTILDGSIEYER